MDKTHWININEILEFSQLIYQYLVRHINYIFRKVNYQRKVICRPFVNKIANNFLSLFWRSERFLPLTLLYAPVVLFLDRICVFRKLVCICGTVNSCYPQHKTFDKHVGSITKKPL